MTSQAVQGWHPNPQLMQPQQQAQPPQGWTGSWPPGGNVTFPPGYPGPPPIPGGEAAHPRWNAGYWQYNPQANVQNPQQPWAPGMGWFPPNFNPYKRVPKPPSPSYWNTKLSDNGLGLEGMVKRYVGVSTLARSGAQTEVDVTLMRVPSPLFFFLLAGGTHQTTRAKNHKHLGYGIQRVCAKLGIMRPPRETLMCVGPGRWIAAFITYPHPREIMVRAVEDHHRRVPVLKYTTRHQKGGLLGGPTTIILPKIILPLDQQDTVLTPPKSGPARAEVASLAHPFQINVPLAKLTLGSVDLVRSLLLRARYRPIHRQRQPFLVAVLLQHSKPCSHRNPRHSHPEENSTQRSRQVSFARRRTTNNLVVVLTSHILVTTLVRRLLRVTPRHLHTDPLFPIL